MNIFVTNPVPIECAAEHCDVHLRKMIVETAQILSTAHYLNDSVVDAYKPTHIHHPCVKWASASYVNYHWLAALFESLCYEYQYRFDKIHATARFLDVLKQSPKNFSRQFIDFKFGFVQAMPIEFKDNSVFLAYQNYLNNKFSEWLTRERVVKVEWSNRKPPTWYRG